MVVTEVVDTLKRNELLLDAPPHEEDESEEWYCLKVVTVSSTGLLRFSCRIEGKTRNGGSREKSVGIYAACHTCRGDKELSIWTEELPRSPNKWYASSKMGVFQESNENNLMLITITHTMDHTMYSSNKCIELEMVWSRLRPQGCTNTCTNTSALFCRRQYATSAGDT